MLGHFPALLVWSKPAVENKAYMIGICSFDYEVLRKFESTIKSDSNGDLNSSSVSFQSAFII